MTVISLDQSLSSTGITLVKDNELVMIGSIRRPKEITEEVKQLIYMIDKISYLMDTYNPTYIILEGLPFGMNSPSVRPLAALFYMILIECYNRGIKYTVVRPTEAKKIAGSGKLKKNDMIDALPEEIVNRLSMDGYKKTTGLADAADSYWIYKVYEKKTQKETN